MPSNLQSLLRSAGRQLSDAAALWRRSLALVLAAASRQVVALGALMAAQAFLPLATLWASRGVIDAAAQTFGVTSPPAAASGGLPLAAWLALAVGAIVLLQLLGPLFQATQESAGGLLSTHVNGEIIRASNRWRGLARFEDPAFADHLTAARNQAARGPLEMVTQGAGFLKTIFTIIAMGIALWRLHPLAPLLIILAQIPQALQENDFSQKMSVMLRVESREGRELTSHQSALLGAATAKDVRLFDLGGFFLGMYTTVFGRMTAAQWALRREGLRRMAPAQALSAAAAAAVYLYAIHRVLGGDLTLGDLVLFGGALVQLEFALTDAGFAVGFFGQTFAWLPSLFLVLNAGPDLPVAPHPVPAPRPVRTGLVLDHVSFRYPGTSATILHDVSFALQPGERLALVGRNGAGKTTLVKLLARLYDPTEGRILLDGVDLRDYDLDDLRRQIGAIFQDFVCFDLTAQENVGLGELSHLDDLVSVARAAQKGGAATLIEELPQGYATPLGNQFGGVNLSGGQWQKIALSRAFMRQAQLLILDEPTAALDVQTEYDVYLRFSELTKGAMTVLVSHRFSTVRMAEHIVYLEDGRLVEEGSHDDLMRRAGGYAHLYHLQADLYQ